MATGNICIFGSSSNNIDRKYIDAACETGALLAENGLGMVFGGGAVGLMGLTGAEIINTKGCP